VIHRPTLLLDKKRCLRNLEKMIAKANANNISLRPHFKTPQSHTIGRWCRAMGIEKITVSSLRMAKYFADDHWNDITVAIPVNVLEIDLIRELATKIQLHLLVEDIETVDFLSKNLVDSSIRILIKIDAGYHRTGITYDNFERIDSIIHAIEQAKSLHFLGFLTHSGHTYNARNYAEIAAIHDDSLSKMAILKQHYERRFPNLMISVGDTPTCSVMNEFGVATEIRPGNFMFYDVMQYQITACALDEIAVAVACPVIAKHPERNEIIIYGGGVHFSKDVLEFENLGKVFGFVAKNDGALGWSSEMVEGVYLKKISQEHGTIQATKEFIENCKIGDIIKILPVHSCMTADLMKQYLTTEGEWVEHLSGLAL
jgi:D-serine deaminase-like pyridoxal phosphate-dependent protein